MGRWLLFVLPNGESILSAEIFRLDKNLCIGVLSRRDILSATVQLFKTWTSSLNTRNLSVLLRQCPGLVSRHTRIWTLLLGFILESMTISDLILMHVTLACFLLSSSCVAKKHSQEDLSWILRNTDVAPKMK